MIFVSKFYELKKENEILKSTQILDKKTYANDLNEIFSRYDSALLKNKMLEASYYLRNSKLKSTLSIIAKNNPKVIPVFVSDKNKLEIQSKDSLKDIIVDKTAKKEVVFNQFPKQAIQSENVYKPSVANDNLKNITAVNVFASGIKVVSSNVLETKRHINTEQIRICFSLLENKTAAKGGKDIYVQIINPEHKIISEQIYYSETDQQMQHFTAKTNIFYDNEAQDICVFVDTKKEEILKGDYQINLISDLKIIGNTTLHLK